MPVKLDRLLHKLFETCPQIHNITEVVLVQSVNLTDDKCPTLTPLLPLHEAPFTEELGKPSVFRKGALLASELFTLSFGRY